MDALPITHIEMIDGKAVVGTRHLKAVLVAATVMKAADQLAKLSARHIKGS